MRYLSLIALLFLAACASATSQTPQVTQAELAREQQLQKEILQREAAYTAPKNVKMTNAMGERFALVSKRVQAAGLTICRELSADQSGCGLPFAIDTENADLVNAYTDGKKIVTTPAMLVFANSNDQLATVLAHEYAHAIMQHPSKTGQNVTIGTLIGLAADTLAKSQGVATGGILQQLGASSALLHYSQDFEREADYIGMYILQRAGYNIDNAATLWRRMAALNPDGIYNGSTHPTTAERYVLLDKTVAEIKAKIKAGKAVLPDFIPQS